MYDESGDAPSLIFSATAPAAKSWKELRKGGAGVGYQYRSKASATGELDKIVLRAGAHGKAKASVKARGKSLTLPDLPLNLPVRVQFQSSNGQCWDATYSKAGVKGNGRRAFRATAD